MVIINEGDNARVSSAGGRRRLDQQQWGRWHQGQQCRKSTVKRVSSNETYSARVKSVECGRHQWLAAMRATSPIVIISEGP